MPHDPPPLLHAVIGLLSSIVAGAQPATPPPTPASSSTATASTDALAFEIPDDAQKATVVRVRDGDGDTIIVTIGTDQTKQRVCRIGVDTPETVKPNAPIDCYGPEASDYLKTMFTDQADYLEADPTQGDSDRYDRLLRYVWLPTDAADSPNEAWLKGRVGATCAFLPTEASFIPCTPLSLRVSDTV
ncbi:thermonuclease family protein [Rathayibacter rathayi]|uniref:thermonuclease family protein n=1 Tax=Rathayibacter rathayi TaxID=33887 RepID=UPI000CE8D962|nr:thermonuclease family protein [Rathayibacter rathayi]PPH34145.1 hypothetical protein C5C28_10065 [Rathayibacter rathayi]